MSRYRTQFNEYVAAKKAEAGESGGLRISVTQDSDGKSSLKVDASRGAESLNTSDMPPYRVSEVSLAEAVGPTVVDFGILGFDILFVFAAAFVAFLKYDLR
jgi:hypothetical protein